MDRIAKSQYIKILIGLSISLLTPGSWAEYRAFRMQIYDGEGNIVREFVYNLDPEQYVGYWPLAPGQNIRYVETWLCPGRTAPNLKFCKSPSEILAEQEPAQASAPVIPPQN